MSMKLKKLIEYLREFAPLELAEDWDNVGLLVGDMNAEICRVLTCLTLTPDVVVEAIQHQAELIVSHHPIMFRSINKITSQNSEGQMLLDLVSNKIAVYSPHTAFDSSALGINEQLATDLGLTSIKPIRPIESESVPSGSGSGRYGKLNREMELEKFLDHVKQTLQIPFLQYTGNLSQKISTVGVACGSAAEYLQDAVRLGCDVLVTGEARFHASLEARILETAMVLTGHFASERPAVERLAVLLAEEFPNLKTWASEVESDPVQWSVS